MKAIRLAILLICSGCSAQHMYHSACPSQPAEVLVHQINAQPWSSWTVHQLRQQLPMLKPITRRPAFRELLTVVWSGSQDPCVCCATVVVGTDDGNRVATEPHLLEVTVFHQEPTFDRAVETAKSLALAVSNRRMLERVAQAPRDKPLVVDTSVTSRDVIIISTLRLYRLEENWVWQYEEVRYTSQ